MSPARNRLARRLLIVAIACCAGAMLVAFRSRDGNLAERLTIVLFIGFGVSMCLFLMLVAATTARYKVDVMRLRRRPALSADEFIAHWPSPGKLDRDAIRLARTLAARHLKGFGGPSIRPTDRLEEDLHLPDLGPWFADDFSEVLAETLNIDENVVERMFNKRSIATFGDLVLAIAEVAETVPKVHPLWDRNLDARASKLLPPFREDAES